MKHLIWILLFLSPSAFATKVFIEPGVFVNMMNNAKATYHDGTEEFEGVMRNSDLSYALKFGVHFGKFEVGIESELYNLVGHFEKDTGDFTKQAQVSYNSFFVGYEFLTHHYAYLAISGKPYMVSGAEGYVEDSNVVSLEYSYHIKEWVSFNVKYETASELTNQAATEKKFEFKNLLMVGFSFPIVAEY